MFGLGTKVKASKFPSRIDTTTLQIDELDKTLAEEAAQFLGYTEGLDAIKLQVDSVKLREILGIVGISPFNKREVIDYKKKMERKMSSGFYRARWVEARLLAYTKPIPQFALHTALQIKKQEPKCEIWVDSLVIEQLPLDPFMYVVLGKAFEYVEVWDQSDFTAKRQA